MPLEVLSSDGEDALRWTEAIAGLPPEHRDIHFLPEYGRIYEACYGFKAQLAVYRHATGYVVQPFVGRPLGGLPFLSGAADGGPFTDIANAYGYGGPVANVEGADAAALYADFAQAFAEWCEVEGIASEFCSLHPLLHAHQRALIGDVRPLDYVKDVVILDLRPDENGIARGLRKGHRSSIALARKSGVRVEAVEPSAANLAVFNEMYRATMVRRDAASRWFLPDDFFAVTCRSLGTGRCSLLFASVGEEIESGCVLMHDFGTAYYHFAATRARHPALGINNLMVWEAAMHAKRMGYATLHLGGGVSASQDDSLLRFKAGFGDGRAPLYTYFTVRNRAVYDELCARKREHERRTAGAESQSGFLPLYRR